MDQHLSLTQYQNPLLPGDFPDPSVIEVPGEGWYVYGTHDEHSPTINNILVSFSTNLVDWSTPTGALVEPPVWAKTCNKFWCPHVVKVGNEYRLYYSAEPDTKDGMCLAVAVSDSPTGFRDIGHALAGEPGSGYRMIDPCFFADPASGKHYLYYGSSHEPIRAVELAPDGTFSGQPVDVLYPGTGQFERLREGAFLTYDPVWKRYFMWVSGDNTWAENGYAITVYWSGNPLSGFQAIPGGPVVLRANDVWDSPGQNSMIIDSNGQQWIFYHAVQKSDRYISGTNIFCRKFCMDPVYYTNEGWPYISDHSPSFRKRDGPVVLHH